MLTDSLSLLHRYPNVPDQPAVKLTAINGRYIGVCWLWAIIIFLVMEVFKYLVYAVPTW
jgi:hypothetical protein